MAKKGEKLSEEHRKKIKEASLKRWAKARKDAPKKAVAKAKKIDPITLDEKAEAKEVVVVKPKAVITNPAGRPLSPKLTDIKIEELPTKYTTAEQIRGYILAQTDGGRQVVDTILADFRSKKSTKQIKRDLAKMILDLIIPERGQKLDFAMESPDGKFAFRWQNEVTGEEK